jgi:hypothetical protein
MHGMPLLRRIKAYDHMYAGLACVAATRVLGFVGFMYQRGTPPAQFPFVISFACRGCVWCLLARSKGLIYCVYVCGLLLKWGGGQLHSAVYVTQISWEVSVFVCMLVPLCFSKWLMVDG